jgi:hypothetical protein
VEPYEVYAIKYATGRHMAVGHFAYAYEVEEVVGRVRRVYQGRVSFHEGDAEIAPASRCTTSIRSSCTAIARRAPTSKASPSGSTTSRAPDANGAL